MFITIDRLSSGSNLKYYDIEPQYLYECICVLMLNG